MYFYVCFVEHTLQRFVYVVNIISLFLYCSVVFRCMTHHSLFIYSPADGCLGSFQPLAVANKASMNILIQIFMWTYVLISLGYNARSRTAGSWKDYLFNCQKSFPSLYNSSNCFISLSTLGLASVYNFSHTSGYVIVSFYVFSLIALISALLGYD